LTEHRHKLRAREDPSPEMRRDVAVAAMMDQAASSE